LKMRLGRFDSGPRAKRAIGFCIDSITGNFYHHYLKTLPTGLLTEPLFTRVMLLGN
jgi:hypothetical protein